MIQITIHKAKKNQKIFKNKIKSNTKRIERYYNTTMLHDRDTKQMVEGFCFSIEFFFGCWVGERGVW
jgi:CRISPR/Cas system CMR-associated protein Cmr1 (group 7 of RAMP superfamily)